jgi:hypothetical protein
MNRGLTLTKKAKNPSTSKATVTKKEDLVKVRLLKRNKTARKRVIPSKSGCWHHKCETGVCWGYIIS